MKGLLDADFLENYGVRDFNDQLLQTPTEIPSNSYLKRMELEDPALPMLCPLARALYYIDRTEISTYIDDALETIIVLDPDQSVRPSYETVHHEILKAADDKSYRLDFESSAKFIWAVDDDGLTDSGAQIGTLRDCTFLEPLTRCQLAEQLFSLKSNEPRSPMGAPVDDGEFVCLLEYTLKSVNGIELQKKPRVLYAKHSLDWDDVPEMGSACLPDNASEVFLWTTLISEEDLKRAGITTGGSSATDPGGQFDHLGWHYISVEEIHESYQNGYVVKSQLNRVEVLMGCGPEWTPAEGYDEPCHDDAVFDSRQPPLFRFVLTEGCDPGQSGFNNESMALGYEEEFSILKLLIDSSVTLVH